MLLLKKVKEMKIGSTPKGIGPTYTDKIDTVYESAIFAADFMTVIFIHYAAITFI